MIPKVQSAQCLRTVPETTSLGFHLLFSCRARGEAGGGMYIPPSKPKHTHTYFYNPECIQCPSWYYNPAEGGGMKKGTVLKWCHFPVFHSSLLILTATVLPYIQEPVWRNSVWEQNHLYYLSNVFLFYNIIIVAGCCSFSVWIRAG